MASTAAKLLTILSNSGIVYQLRADFPVDATAPMGQSPITYHAEVGDLLLYQQDGVAEWRIVGGVAEVTGTGLTALPVMGHPDGFTRTPGLAFKHRTASNPNGGSGTAKVSPTMGWTNLRHSTASNRVTGLIFWYTEDRFSALDAAGGGSLLGIQDAVVNTFYTFTHVLRSVGSFSIVGDRLVGIGARGNNATMYPVVGQSDDFDRNTPRIDYARVAQLGGPWATDYGIATTRLAGARAVNDTFTHEAGALWLELMLTTLPSSGNIEIELRRTDSNNCWKLQVTSTGAFNLIEVVGGTPTTRTNINSNQAGDRLLLVMEGANARLNRHRDGANIQSGIYTSVSTFTTQTSGVISSLGTGGAISDLVTWPRILTGEAKAWIDAL